MLARNRRGFTLIEALVVIAIVGTLLALLLPAVQQAREAARRASCQANLHNLGIALHNYHDAHRVFPPGYVSGMPFVDGASDTAPGWGWAAMLLPFVEQGPLYEALNAALPIGHGANVTGIAARVPAFLCPSDPLRFPMSVADSAGTTLVADIGPASYAACAGGDETDVALGSDGAGAGQGVFFRNSRVALREIADGTSKTILLGERAWSVSQGCWPGAVPRGVLRRGPRNPCPPDGAALYPAAALALAHSHLNNTSTDPDGGLDDFSSMHVAGSFFLFADGAVGFVPDVPNDLASNPDGSAGYSAASRAFQALGTRARGDSVQGLDF